MTIATNPLTLGRKAPPTQRHRVAVWENMLGTVCAMNDEGAVRYFDYRWDEAVAYAGVTPERDPRASSVPPAWRGYRLTNDPTMRPHPKQKILWIARTGS